MRSATAYRWGSESTRRSQFSPTTWDPRTTQATGWWQHLYLLGLAVLYLGFPCETPHFVGTVNRPGWHQLHRHMSSLVSRICSLWKAACTWSILYDLELVVSAFSTETEQTEWHMGCIWVAHTLWSDYSNNGCLQKGRPRIQQLFGRSSVRLDVLAALPCMWESFGSRLCHKWRNVLDRESLGEQGKSKHFFPTFHTGCHQEVRHRFKVGLPTSNDPIKKSLTGVPSSLGFNYPQMESMWQPTTAVTLAVKCFIVQPLRAKLPGI